MRLLLLTCLPSTLSAQAVDWQRFAQLADVRSTLPETLSKQLTSDLTTDRDKAAAIFYWITHNIAYDVSLFEDIVAGKKGKRARYTQAEIDALYEARIARTLKKRKGVCDNYSRLYQRLAELAGLECQLIAGHARGNIMAAGQLGISHAWNAVKIDGEWRLLDATWGAGAVNNEMKFNFKFRPAYFLAPPEAFALNHFPKDAKWQLLESPVSRADYLSAPAIGTAFIAHEVTGLSHPTYRLETLRREALRLEFTSPTLTDELACVNYTEGVQIPCAITKFATRLSVVIPGKMVQRMVLGLVNAQQQLVLGYQVLPK